MNENDLKESYGTLSETINRLVKLGYTHDFNIKDEWLISQRNNITLSPNDFKIDHVYRFDGDSDPDYQSILYAISSVKHDIKGTLVNGYGISSDEASSKLVEKLETNTSQATNENKPNDERQHQDGERIVNQPLVEMNLVEFIKQLKSETNWANSDRSLTIFKSETMRIVLIGLHENAELKPHKANGVISVQVLEGTIEFNTDQQSILIEKGQMIALQENITHSVKALSESFFLLTLALNRK